jgi:cytochrome c peroxidase
MNRSAGVVIVVIAIVLFAIPVAVATNSIPGSTSPPEWVDEPAVSTAYGSQEELGKVLFFDPRLSDDGQTSCASCHLPSKSWTDGKALSDGGTSNLYFRNTPTLLNATKQGQAFWDGRLHGSDPATVVREHIVEAHFGNLDGRLMVERILQVPEYDAAFRDQFGGEPSFGKVLNAVVAFLNTLESEDNPYVDYKGGDNSALSDEQIAGLNLFEGKAGCSSCHSGELLTDNDWHAIGASDNPEIFTEPERHITFRRFFKILGVGTYAQLREDIGLSALTHEDSDLRKFRTPSLLEAGATAPYMHSGMLATLSDVVRFYNDGGGSVVTKDAAISPLGLSESEIAQLVAFLESLQSPIEPFTEPEIPSYGLLTLGGNQ